MIALAYVLKHLGTFAAAGLLMAAGLYVEGLRLEVGHDKKVIAQERVNVATLQAAVKTQNASIDAAAAADRLAQAKAAKALHDALRSRASLSRQLAWLRSQKEGTDPCKSADQLILQSLSH